MEKKTVYLDHKQICELLDVPEDKTVWYHPDDDALLYDHRAEMWKLEMMVGTKEEAEEEAKAFT